MLKGWQQRRRRNQLTAEIITWLDAPHPQQILETIRSWDQATWRVAESVTLIQGIAPYLHHALPRTPVYAALPPSFRQHLAREYALNAERVRRLHDDLALILRDANRSGIPVMPLKGSLLSARHYAAPALRPMADLDLLVRPEDKPGLSALLEKLGYRLAPPKVRHDTTATYINPDGYAPPRPGEHPDNPRPVDLHTDLKKGLQDGVALYDLTAFIWRESQETELLGQRAWTPTPERFLVHLATHALRHCMYRTGRAMQWLDLAHVAPLTRQLDPPDADWIYPALTLAARALPRHFAGLDLSPLAERTHPRLRRWAASVPLDGRCGLNLNTVLSSRLNFWTRQWMRWYPSPSRLALRYGNTPLPWALGRHTLAMLRHFWRRKTSLWSRVPDLFN
jgi:hypothetical protein